MTNLPSRRRFLAACGVSLASLPYRAHAADGFPRRPVTLLVPFPAGGTADVTYRVLATATEPYLGQPVVIENRPGASATLGVMAMLNTPPDGYRLTIVHSAVLRMQLMQKTPYDARKDITPIIAISAFNVGLMVRKDSPFRTFKDFVEAARKNPGGVSYGSNGAATAQHLALVQVAEQEGVQFNHIPYKGDAEATNALLGGHIDAHAGGTGMGELVDGGKARWLALFSDERLARWPDVPTLYDLGYQIPASSPNGIVGPAGMDPSVVRTLHDAFKQALFSPSHRQALERAGQAVQYLDGEDFGKLLVQHYALEHERIAKAGLLAAP
ncbi:tripartite tricarboxylate transporter substrate binding protein [Bordetella sp. BOR01]|uniref:Bug family tripartite tricarboxylate transporter substrate binding protein n=1 Tax=Bordetella sp. BOR01 TaxID=2854779 RepID=UPI001C495425|nr:tripartite tricarboxylate transporter substrate binding protein [Bordetella sp. BOR01]MBV7483825.1 tripartite tricarboxylate transporter substrate binding protein [Bordetella sp. BOR01]